MYKSIDIIIHVYRISNVNKNMNQGELSDAN